VHSHLIHASLDQSESKSQTASRLVQPFLPSSRQRVCILYNRPPLPPQNCPFAWADLDPHLIRASLGQTKSITQMESRSVQPFFAQHTADGSNTLNGSPLPPQNCPFPRGDLNPSNTWFLWPTGVHIPNDISIGSAISAVNKIATDKPFLSSQLSSLAVGSHLKEDFGEKGDRFLQARWLPGVQGTATSTERN